jgi:hypothetical protein
MKAMGDDMSPLAARWTKAAVDLGLKVVTPCEFAVAPAVCLRVPLVLRDFGAREGRLLLSDYSVISRWLPDIELAGYGYSVVSEPPPNEAYSRQDCIDLLNDSGWTGRESLRPTWLK